MVGHGFLVVLRLTVFGCALLVGGGASASTQSAATFIVTTTTDRVEDVDANPGDGICATADHECTLRAAVQESNALDGPQTISLPPGEYSLLRGGYGENAADRGDLDITDDLTVAGAGRSETAISGKYETAERIFDVRAPAAITISDLAVRDVFMSSILPNDESCGGGIRNAGSLSLMRVDIVDNVFRRSGGGVCNQGELHVMDSTISRNQAALIGGGGGIRNEGVAVLERVTISDNISDTLGGGGIYNYGGVNAYGVPIDARLTLTDSTISGNTSRYSGSGGGIANVGPGAEATVINSVISGNDTPANPSSNDYAHGGGLSAYGGARITLVNSTVSGNRASLPGGGLSSKPGYLPGQGVVTLVNTIVARNENGDCAGAMTSQAHNLDGDGSCGLSAEGDLSGVDPMLGPLADNGGPTLTHALLEGSPAIDGGGAERCPGHDQRGAPRPFDGDGLGGAACDIGSFEFGSEPGPFPPPLSGDADCSTTVEATDALSVLRHVAGLPPLAACLDLGDVNCDLSLDAVDALLILRYVAALPVTLPPVCPPIGPPP